MSVSVQIAETMCSSQNVGSIYVECFEWIESSMGQSSYYPCDANTITVTLRPNIAILAECKAGGASASTPKITITGFDNDGIDNDGSLTAQKAVFSNDANTTLVLTGVTETESSVPATGAWNPVSSTTSDGTLTIVNGAIGAATQVIFTFALTNSPIFTDDATNVRVKIDQYNKVCCTGGSADAGCPLGAIHLLDPDFATFSSVTQSSPYPCATNTITVDLWSSVPSRRLSVRRW